MPSQTLPNPANSLEAARLEPLALARSFALGIGGAIVALSGLAWGVRGTVCALAGTIISLGNVWLMNRLGVRARREAASFDPAAAAVRLQVALGAKTVAVLVLVAALANRLPAAGPGVAMIPFSLGLLVTVFALLAGGLFGRPL